MNLDQKTKVGPKDFFLHLLAIVALYTSAVSFLVLIFQYVNVLIPDALNPYASYRFGGGYQAIRWSIATLIVIFPVYVLTSRFLNKVYLAEPEKRDLKVRKWLIYFTLFVAALIIIGDLVTLIFNLLEGELTTRFILKVLAVFFVAGSVFYYYFWDLRNEKPKYLKQFVYGVITIVAVTVLAGFFIVGSPKEERIRRFDDRRVQDLQTLQWEVVNYWQNKEKLPEGLSVLEDGIRGFVPPKDPETGAEYAYEAKGLLEFSLCANFARPSFNGLQTNSPKPFYPEGGLNENWEHKEGFVCFSRTIDKDLYPPREKPIR